MHAPTTGMELPLSAAEDPASLDGIKPKTPRLVTAKSASAATKSIVRAIRLSRPIHAKTTGLGPPHSAKASV